MRVHRAWLLAAGLVTAGGSCSTRMPAASNDAGTTDAGAPDVFTPVDHPPPAEGEVISRPCASATRVGSFWLWLDTSGAAYERFYGIVITPPFHDFERPAKSEGACTLMTYEKTIACTRHCPDSPYCYADGSCIRRNSPHNVGIVELDGLANPVALSFPSDGSWAYDLGAGMLPSPPAAPGALITLHATGGEYTPFTLYGRGIAPLLPPADGFHGLPMPLSLTWDAAGQPSPARVRVALDLGRNDDLELTTVSDGYVVCDFPDTGSAEVPAALLDELIAMGIGTAPQISVHRHTIDSTAIAAGCVDFTVESGYTLRLN